MSDEKDKGRELDWDGQIENDGADFTLLPEGEYDFQVKNFTRARHPGSAKLPPCNKAVLSIDLMDEDGRTLSNIDHNLFLHTKTEGLLCQFFRSIGARKHGEKLVMDWNKIIGKAGRCKVIVRDWQGKDGTKKQSNQIDKFLDPPGGPAGQEFKEGEF